LIFARCPWHRAGRASRWRPLRRTTSVMSLGPSVEYARSNRCRRPGSPGRHQRAWDPRVHPSSPARLFRNLRTGQSSTINSMVRTNAMSKPSMANTFFHGNKSRQRRPASKNRPPCRTSPRETRTPNLIFVAAPHQKSPTGHKGNFHAYLHSGQLDFALRTA
jgi:hypothetical protein